MRSSTALVCLLAAIAAPSPASAQPEAPAPSKDQCLDAHVSAQVLERDGKLGQARRQFELCAHKACPSLVKKECAPRLAEVSAKIASIRLEAPDGASVTLDGEPLPTPGPDGSIELDPGEHTLKLTTADGRSSEQRVSLSPGQRDLAVTLRAPEPAPVAPPPAPEPEPSRPIPTRVYVLGGVAALGVAGFVGFGLLGRAKQSELEDCKPNCAQSDYDSMKQRYLFADISLGVAAIAGGLAAYFYFDDRKHGREQSQGAYLGAQPLPGGALIGAGSRF